MKELIARFLLLLDEPPPADDAMLRKLAHTLDALNHAVAELPAGRQATGFPDPPRPDEHALRRKICLLFPDLGLYPSVDPLTDLSKDVPEPLIEDAIDDLVDIASDLSEAEWRFLHVDELDAFWNLHFYYRAHWGRHLLNLRSLLHAMLNEND